MGKSKIRLILLILPLTLMLMLVYTSSALADTDITVFINNQQLEVSQEPIIENGRVLAPLRAIMESFGLNIDYNDATKTITVSNTEHVIVLVIGSAEALVDGKVTILDVPAKIVNSYTMVPLRFIGESLGLMVEWSPETRSVLVSEYEHVLFRAAWNADLEMAKMCLDAGANPNSNKLSIPLIHSCMDNNNVEMLKLLFEYGADPNAIYITTPNLGGYQTTFANCPEPTIFRFLSAKKIDCIKLFIEYGLDLNIKNNLNQTPLAYMSNYSYQDDLTKQITSLLSNAVQQKSSYVVKEGDAKCPDKLAANDNYIYTINDEYLDHLQLHFSDINDNMKAGSYGGQYHDVRPFGINRIFPESTPAQSSIYLNINNPLDTAYIQAARGGQSTMNFRDMEAIAIYSAYEKGWIIELAASLPASEVFPQINISQLNTSISLLETKKNVSDMDGYDNYSITFSQRDIDVTEEIAIIINQDTKTYTFKFTPYYYRY